MLLWLCVHVTTLKCLFGLLLSSCIYYIHVSITEFYIASVNRQMRTELEKKVEQLHMNTQDRKINISSNATSRPSILEKWLEM